MHYLGTCTGVQYLLSIANRTRAYANFIRRSSGLRRCYYNFYALLIARQPPSSTSGAFVEAVKSYEAETYSDNIDTRTSPPTHSEETIQIGTLGNGIQVEVVAEAEHLEPSSTSTK